MNVRKVVVVRHLVQAISILTVIGLSIGIYFSFAPVGYIEHVDIFNLSVHLWYEPVYDYTPAIIYLVIIYGIIIVNAIIRRFFTIGVYGLRAPPNTYVLC